VYAARSRQLQALAEIASTVSVRGCISSARARATLKSDTSVVPTGPWKVTRRVLRQIASSSAVTSEKPTTIFGLRPMRPKSMLGKQARAAGAAARAPDRAHLAVVEHRVQVRDALLDGPRRSARAPHDVSPRPDSQALRLEVAHRPLDVLVGGDGG
jgi:hypothetical protein